MAIFRPYRGAGLIFTSGSDVLLARRAIEPFKGHWSCFGGKQEAVDFNKPFLTAIRETSEETGGNLERLQSYLAVPLDESQIEREVIDWPFFNWTTYFVPLKRKPDFSDWPRLNFEFFQAGWFATTCLPRPLHPFVLTPKLSGIGK